MTELQLHSPTHMNEYQLVRAEMVTALKDVY